MQHVLCPQLSADEAIRIVARRAHNLGDPMVSFYPLTGVVFQLGSSRGPARALDGNLFHCVVDRVSGTPLLSADWGPLVHLQEEPPAGAVQPEPRMSVAEAIHGARQVVFTSLIRRVKLAARISLTVHTVTDPLWKPNWLIRTRGAEFLVDGLNGNVVTRSLVG